jgi:hypothetical protein
MKDLSSVTHKDFEACLNQSFTVRSENQDGLEIELIQVKLIGDGDPEKDTRQAFSVLFRGSNDHSLAQSVYRIENETLGELQLFLVPIGPDESGMLYDASFN